MNDNCQELLLNSLNTYYNKNEKFKKELKVLIEGKHKLSLRLIDWLVTHYSKKCNVNFWIKGDQIYDNLPIDKKDDDKYKKVNLYLNYRAQLKSYAKLNFDTFRRHNRITFYINKNDSITTTIGQLNFFRWAFNNNIIEYGLKNYDKIYNNMIANNNSKQDKKNFQEITNTLCILRFD
jgi:hypothetical protein